MSSGHIRVCIIEDSLIHQEWLQLELESDQCYKVITCERQGRKGLHAIKLLKPDLVVLDFQLKDVTGLEVAKRIKCFDSSIRVFCITAHTEASIIERLINNKDLDAIAVKGSSYFEKNFLTAVHSAMNGEGYVDPSLLHKFRQFNKVGAISQLTKQEFEVFIQIKTGRSDEAIAQDLSVQVNHIKNIKSRIAHKLRRSDLNHLVSKLIANIDPGPFH